MGLFKKKHDVTDIYGVKKMKESPFTRKGEEEAPETGRRHSDYYHKYFRGYTEVRRLNAKGRVTIERYYTQPWIVNSFSNVRYWLLRLLYVVLTAVSSALFVLALIQKLPGNYTWVVALPGYISVIFLFLLVVAVLGYVFVERKMTLWGHHSSTKKLKRYALASGIAQLVTAAAMAGVALFTGLGIAQSLQWAAAILLSGICSGAMYFIERRIPYREIPNDTKVPNGEAHEIW